MFYRIWCWIAVACVAATWCASVGAAEGGERYPLVQGKPFIFVVHDGKSVKVQRKQDPNYQLEGYFARTVRECPPFCLQPEHVAPGVETIGEVELFDFMENDLRDGTGILIDARTPSWHGRGTIPGSVNYPFTLFAKDADNAKVDEILKSFGAKPRGEVPWWEQKAEEWGLRDSTEKTAKWDFTLAKTLVLFCNGPECGQSPRAIRGLLAQGYPAAKLKYYRGGMQVWLLWGLTTVTPGGHDAESVTP